MLDKLAERFTAEWVQERTAVIDEFLGTREDVETSDNRSPGDFIGTVLTEDARERFFEAFTEMLLRMTQVWTVVLLFDDADSGDEESLRLLKHLVRVVFERRGLRKRGKREISLLIVLGYDTRAIAQNRLMKNFLISLRGDHLDQFQVRPLQDKEISSLVVSMLGHPLDPPGLAELVQQSQGNPLLAVQTLHRWIDSDRLLPGPDALQLILEEDSSPTVVLVEDKLRNLLARRISDLPEVENLLLGAAAILGGRFAPEHLAMIADTASDRVPGMLESWIARGLVIEQWDDVHGRELYRLAHASLGSELIQRMSPAERARLNLRAADFIVRGVIKVPRGAMPAILLQHYRGAGRFEQAIHQALEAGRIARRQLLQDRALAAFSIGMAMWEDLTQSRREALRTVAYELCHEQALTLSSLGRCAEAREIIKPPLENAMMRQDLFWQARFEDALYAFDRYQGRFRQALQHLQHILELLNQLGDEHGVVRTLNNIGAISTFRGKIREAHLYLQEAEQRAQRLKDFALNADILLNLGKLYSISADYPKALSTLEQALLLYDRLGIKEPRYNILSTISSIYLQNGQLRRACDSFKELASQCRANGTPRDLGLSLINLAVSRASLGDVRPGLKDIRAANDIFLRLGDDARLAITSLNQAFSLLELSRFPQVARALRRTRLHAKRAGVSHALALADLAEAQMHSYQARYQQALECCNRSLKRQTALGQRSHLVETLLWTARIEEAQGLDRQAEDHLGAAHRAALDGCNQVTYAQLLVWRGFRQVRSDHPSEGFALLKDGADRLRNMEHSFQTAFSQSLLGLAQAWIGQPAEGLIQCGTAVTAAFNLDLPLAVALTNFYNCLCLVISGRWTELLRETSLHAEAAAQANIDDLTWRYGMLESRALEMLGQHREAVLRRQIAREILSRLNDGHPEIVNRAASAFWRIIQDAPARG